MSTRYTKKTSGAEVMGCGSAPIKGTASDSTWRCPGSVFDLAFARRPVGLFLDRCVLEPAPPHDVANVDDHPGVAAQVHRRIPVGQLQAVGVLAHQVIHPP